MKNSKQGHLATLAAGLLLLLAVLFSPVILAGESGEVLALQFSSDVTDPEQPQFIDDLSSYVGAPLLYLKPIGGGEHLFQLAKPLPKQKMRKLVSRLEKHQQIRQVKVEH